MVAVSNNGKWIKIRLFGWSLEPLDRFAVRLIGERLHISLASPRQALVSLPHDNGEIYIRSSDMPEWPKHPMRRLPRIYSNSVNKRYKLKSP